MSARPRKHQSTTYRAEMKLSNGKWHSWFGSVRDEDGQLLSPSEVHQDLGLMRMAIGQWDPDGKHVWRLVERTTTWAERVVSATEGGA